MCFNGKCLHCIEVETGTLIFAILNMIFTSLGTLALVGGLIAFNVMYPTIARNVEMNDALDFSSPGYVHEQRSAQVALLGLGVNAALAIFLVAFVIAFSFAVVLIVGSCKRNANHLKAFFVYGVTRLVLEFIASCIAAMAMPGIIIIYVISAIFNSLILLMIRMTYLKFEAETAYKSYSNPLSVITN